MDTCKIDLLSSGLGGKTFEYDLDDDFFALGGDSIKCAMVSEKCGVYHISTADIFAGKTPRMIERLLIQKASSKKRPEKKNKVKVYPLTPSERGMYLEQKLNTDSTVYNLNIAAIPLSKS